MPTQPPIRRVRTREETPAPITAAPLRTVQVEPGNVQAEVTHIVEFLIRKVKHVHAPDAAAALDQGRKRLSVRESKRVVRARVLCPDGWPLDRDEAVVLPYDYLRVRLLHLLDVLEDRVSAGQSDRERHQACAAQVQMILARLEGINDFASTIH